ncbi:MAG: PTS glucitol/sorbitol transporter subunit IIA [Anaerolineae bacterium]|nr:PTS glucitol/sorbitol transporter subunit IIA [Anaerolineae bacterium]
MIKYQANVTFIGPMVSEFIENHILILFGESAPEELMEFAIIHDGKNLIKPLAVNDSVQIGESSYKVLAIGEVANTNLANLGHLVLKFNGNTSVEMPGDVCLEEKPLPPIQVGEKIMIYD